MEDHGLRLLARNYRTRRGEIDLIMQDADVIVFVEVRSRRHAGFMHPAFSVDLRKQTRLILAGQHYLQNAGLLDSAMCRFDVVSVTGEVGAGEIEWIRGAFEA